ncbi:TPA: hypothetical protein ACJR4Y_000978 [Streptococcus agalactiae]
MTIKEIQEKIVAELRDKVSAGEFSENNAVAYWSDETGVYAYSLEEKDIEHHSSVTSIRDLIETILES